VRRVVGFAASIASATLGVACGLTLTGDVPDPAIDAAPTFDAATLDANGAFDAGSDSGSSIALPGWTKKRELVLDNSGNGALADFPLLLRLNASRIAYESTLPGGADLRITNEQSTVLAHEIERWNPGGQSIVWVKVPAIPAGTTVRLFMYYGNPNAQDEQKATSVWSSGYLGVWHLADDHDSTGAHASANAGAQAADGFVGRGLSFNGVDQYFDTKASETLADFTIEVMMRAQTAANLSGPSGPMSHGLHYQFQWNCGAAQFCQAAVCQPKGTATIAKLGSLVASRWYYLAATYDGTTLTSYVDGAEASAVVGGGGPSTAENGSTKLGARMTINTGEFFQGLVDEARISTVARSAHYVRAQSRSLRDTFVSYGAEIPP
jgi:hypothetical protein